MGGRLAGFMVSRLRSRTSTPPKGVRTTFACAAFADWVPDYDASVVERMMEAGAIIVGKLNLHEAASGTISLVSHSGPVHNPWNTDYVAGVSSGGVGAAVVAPFA